jgi:hypothetical protein
LHRQKTTGFFSTARALREPFAGMIVSRGFDEVLLGGFAISPYSLYLIFCYAFAMIIANAELQLGIRITGFCLYHAPGDRQLSRANEYVRLNRGTSRLLYSTDIVAVKA